MISVLAFNPQLTQFSIMPGIFVKFGSTLKAQAGTDYDLLVQLYNDDTSVANCPDYISTYQSEFSFNFQEYANTNRVQPQIFSQACSGALLVLKIRLCSDFGLPTILYLNQKSSPQSTVLYFAILPQQLSAELSGPASFNITYIEKYSPDAISGSEILSETVFVLPFALVDSFGNPARQFCCLNCFQVTGSEAMSQVSVSFSEESNFCNVFATVLLNGFKEKVTVTSSFLGAGMNAQAVNEKWYGELFQMKIESKITLKVVKDQEWTVWESVVVGILMIAVGIIWFSVKFEKDRKKKK
ncbi:Hypothetical_protein [Hexamita inflata]|uniref:Hypothetical_protein n=1 Tax=Hexamita inflata TaxID=28002 RepID=A0AA86NE74_9EUKA|nr:Hypothetical protein HINF_LOCUS5168 [Hexamita inflata]